MSDRILFATPEALRMMAQTVKRSYLIGGENTDETAVVRATSIHEAMHQAVERWPAGDPWWGELVVDIGDGVEVTSV